MSADCDVGVIGLGTMGSGLARNLASRGQRVAIYSRSGDSARGLAARHPEARFAVCDGIDEMVRRLVRPRVVIVLVPAGSAVDDVIGAFSARLEAGDVLVDAGNSHPADTERRCGTTEKLPWHFVGMGVSGGAEGALNGPSLMPGGDARGWPRLQPLAESIAARSDRGPCVAWCGSGGAGHFVKMVHNGIEYADMQLIAESHSLLEVGLALAPAEVADAFEAWNAGALESFLLGSAARVLRARDPEAPGRLLLDAVLDRAGQKGTGRWTIEAALSLGVAVPALTAAVEARLLSADAPLRSRASASGSGALPPLEDVALDDVRCALYAARIVAYGQGFALLAGAERTRAAGTSLAEVARIWRAGCIIRARVLDLVGQALDAGDGLALPFTAPLRSELERCLPAWRRVAAAALRAGLPLPVSAAALSWHDGARLERGAAALIQALRDDFGAHGYERRDRPGRLVHSDWRSG